MDSVLTRKAIFETLFARINYERQPRSSPGDFKLSNMIRLLQRLGNPQLDYRVIHVAGTKGKGSVCSYVGSILSESGLKTGIYSSPHLERINQRIVIDGDEISDDVLDVTLRKLEPVLQEFDAHAERTKSRKLTFFEVITAAAFQAFSDADVDAVVLEVGMGGRLDSTNVCQPDICVITNISLDHTRQLGSTVAKIAAEKAGIIKPGTPVVSGATDVGARTVIHSVANNNNCEIVQLGDDFDFVSERHSRRQFTYSSRFSASPYQLDHLTGSMRGVHQQQNAAIAIATCERLIQDNWKISNDHIRRGLLNGSLPGRCEIFDQEPFVVLDMAHNVASTIALAQTLEAEIPEFASAEYHSLVFAASREKDVAGMIEPLLNLFDSIIVTQYQDNPRGQKTTDVFDVVSNLALKSDREVEVRVAETPESAWQSILKVAENPHAVCVTGSAFLVAELRPIIVKCANDR